MDRNLRCDDRRDCPTLRATGRAWELNVYADNTLLEKRIIEGGASERKWVAMSVDLAKFASRDVTLRLYQRVLVANRTAGNALWRNLNLE